MPKAPTQSPARTATVQRPFDLAARGQAAGIATQHSSEQQFDAAVAGPLRLARAKSAKVCAKSL